MSLFHTREICSYQSESPFDPRAVCSLPEQGSIVVGTLLGGVNLYAPRTDEQVCQIFHKVVTKLLRLTTRIKISKFFCN